MKEYVPFDVALKALCEGKMIRRKNDGAWYTRYTSLEFTLERFYLDFMQDSEWEISE